MTLSATEWDAKTSAEADGLLKYLRSSSFVAAFIVAEHMLGYTYQLSKKLQGIYYVIFIYYKFSYHHCHTCLLCVEAMFLQQ